MKYFLTIGGRNYDYIRMKFTREASMISKVAELILDPARMSTIPAFNEVVIITKEINNGTPITKWQGKIQTVQDIALPNNTIKIIAYDLKYKVNFVNVLNSGYASIKGSGIFTSEVQTPSITDLTLGTVETTDPSLDTVSLGKSISGSDSKVTRSTAFEMIQIMGDSDIYIHHDGTADYLRDAGSDRSSTMILEHGLNGALMPDIGYNEDEIRRVKQVIVKGTGVGTNFILGTAGSPGSTDKVRQIELPFVSSNATASLAAQTILNELDKTNKYSKFRLDTDVFQFAYDVYDTITLKARLPNKTIEETLKIFSITTTVESGSSDLNESVTFELQNFQRAQLAKMINPIEVSTSELARIKSGISFTQADTNIIPSIVSEELTTNFDSVVSLGDTGMGGLVIAFSSIPSVGTYITLSLKITTRKKGSGTLLMYFGDDAGFYPDHGTGKDIVVSYNPSVGAVTYDSLTFHIPQNQAGRFLLLFGEPETSGELAIEGKAYIQRIGA